MTDEAYNIDAFWVARSPDDEGGREAQYLGSIEPGQTDEYPDVIDNNRVDSFVVSYSSVGLEGVVHRFSVSRDLDGASDDTQLNVEKTEVASILPGERTVIENERNGRAGELILYFVKF